MNQNNIQAYGQLSSLFYDATEKYAPEQEVDFFASCIDQSPGRILEAMSGSGRLQIPLMQRGYVVDGVDCSDAMLERCRQRCAMLELQPKLYQQSLEGLALPCRYSTILIAVGSLQLITDPVILCKALQNLNAHLLPGGNLLIDIFVPDTTIDDFSVSIVRLDERKIIRLTKRHRFNAKQQKVDTFCLYELIVDGIVEQQENELMKVVWYSDHEWQQVLLKAGFEIIRIHDEIFKKSESSRVIHARSVIKN
jgi:SAM-dependent methyltransferase